MKDINITYLTTDNDDYIFNKIIENYNIYHITNIFNLWHFTYYLDLDEDELEADEIINNNNMNLSIIKQYAPNIYNNYEYEYNEYPPYNEEYKNIYHSTLIECAGVLTSRFNDRFYKYINDLDGAEYQEQKQTKNRNNKTLFFCDNTFISII